MSKQNATIPVSKEEVKNPVSKAKYTLTRIEDNKSWSGDKIDYISWKQNGTYGGVSSYPKEGTSFALDLVQGVSSTHITTEIEKVLENTDKYVKFKTNKETYKLVYN